ncbi:hypothetical protein HWV62_14718 [Athelia sp. TMB]|nr:hypothetical protein HWV62_14718 [Athelia sp. TMB]
MLATRTLSTKTLSRSAFHLHPQHALRGHSNLAVTVRNSSSVQLRRFSRTCQSLEPTTASKLARKANEDASQDEEEIERPEHAVISTFDLFSIGVGPSSSHTVGPMRAGKIFITDLQNLRLLEKVRTIKITLYGSLAATGKGHHTPQAILLGLEGSDPETIDTGTIPSRYTSILEGKSLLLGGKHKIKYDMDRDMLWRWDQVLKTHPNGMRFACFGPEGELLAVNEYYSVGGGFVVNDKTKGELAVCFWYYLLNSRPLVDENLFYKGVDKSAVHGARLSQTSSLTEPLLSAPAQDGDTSGTQAGPSQSAAPHKEERPPYVFKTEITMFYPGLAMPHLQRIGQRGSVGPSIEAPDYQETATFDSDSARAGPGNHGRSLRPTRVVGSLDHAVLPMHPRKTMIPAVDFLSCYAIAVNEVNASGGRIVTSPTNGAAGVIPAVLKYITEFVSDDPEKCVTTFLLTASAVGMLFKRGSTISAAEGGCQAEVGVACSMASAGFAACMGATPETVLQAAEIGIEHNLGLTCDPIDGLVQVPCIERNSLGAVKAVTAAQLAMASMGVYTIDAMRVTASDMSVKYKETSLSYQRDPSNFDQGMNHGFGRLRWALTHEDASPAALDVKCTVELQLKVIIAGGGVGGCALALFLSRIDIQVTVLELRSERPTTLAGGFLTISPNGTRILGALGLVDKLIGRENGIKVPSLSMYDSEGMFLGNVPQGREERYGYPSILTARWDVHEVLLDDAAKRGIEVIYGAKVREVAETEAGVTVHWTEGDIRKQGDWDIIVGADGIWSSVRKSIYTHKGMVPPKPTYQGLVGIGGVVPVADVPGLDKFLTLEQPMSMFHGRNGFFGACLYDKTAAKAGWWSTYQTPERDANEWQLSKEESLSEERRSRNNFHTPSIHFLRSVEEYDFKPQVVPIYEVEGLKHWHTSRMVLIGDAAHATPPHSGQGASQALEDAGYLANLMREMLLQNETSVPTAAQLHDTFALFQKARQPRVSMIIAEANRRGNA